MDALLAIDTYLLLAINHLPHSDILNTIAHICSGVGQWGTIWVVVAIILFYREEVRDHLFFIPFIAVGFLSGISEVILKWIIARPRPTSDMGVYVLADPGNYSFPSTHATVSFAFAYICTVVEPKLRVLVYTFAVVISLSRIYLGVHYPSDILAGALLGTGVGMIVRHIELNFLRSKKKKHTKRSR
jgi:undecaprenyl-diphosphatase